MSGEAMPTSTNPLSKAQLPSFVAMLNVSHKNIIKGLWNVDDLSISDKIDSIDAISKDMPKEARREYRKWRFLMDRSRMPDFYDFQNDHIKNIIAAIFEKYTDLEEFARTIMSMKSALNNPDAFDKWIKNEEIKFEESSIREDMKKDVEEQELVRKEMETRREELTAQKEQIDTQLKYLEYQRTMCNTRDSETCYTYDVEKRNLERVKLELDRDKLLAQKTQIEMQLKYLDIYQTMCNTKDTEQYYIDNIIPLVRDARGCILDVEMLIDSARELVEKCENDFANDYKKVSDEICNFTMYACDQALRALDIGRHNVSSRAIASLMILSYGLTKKEREDFLEALYNLEKAENELRELCEQMKSNVKYRSNFDKLKKLIDDINEAMKTLHNRIKTIPSDENSARMG